MSDDTTRRRLLESAGEVFASKGFDASTTREICQRAGANIAAVNYYFGDKQRLYAQCVHHAHCMRVEEVPLPEWAEGTPPEVKLRGFIHSMLERMLYTQRPAWHLELMLRELARPTEACAEVVEQYIRPMADTLSGILQEMRPDHSPEELFPVGCSIVGQCLFYHVHGVIAERLIGAEAYQRLTIERLAEHIADFSLAALGFAPPWHAPGHAAARPIPSEAGSK
jgi:AcrR family transcriptional regulator